MATILNIDTAVEKASVCLAQDGRSLQFGMNGNQKEHASWLHPAIQQLIAGAGLAPGALQAVAVTIGPGSYTGLRVGLSAAKGLCFALAIPLIAVNTLEMMAYASKDRETDLICPMIDARRMEVFMAVYDKMLVPVIEPTAMVVNSASFDSLLQSKKIIFSGSGHLKLRPVIHHPNAVFSDVVATAADMACLSEKKFGEKNFADMAYAEPLYLKEFYSVAF